MEAAMPFMQSIESARVERIVGEGTAALDDAVTRAPPRRSTGCAHAMLVAPCPCCAFRPLMTISRSRRRRLGVVCNGRLHRPCARGRRPATGAAERPFLSL